MSEPWKHHAKVVNGFRMHYVIAGSGYPLVFLHGWPQSWYEWRKIIPALAEKFTVIAPDLRGLGDSERPLTGYDKRTLASDVYELVKSLGFSKIGLTGHDWGGAIAFYFAYDHHGRTLADSRHGARLRAQRWVNGHSPSTALLARVLSRWHARLG